MSAAPRRAGLDSGPAAGPALRKFQLRPPEVWFSIPPGGGTQEALGWINY